MSQTTAQTGNEVRLVDGRQLGYAEYGDPAGKPLFFFHGGGASRLLGELCHEVATRQGVRVIAPDRPGMGLSDPQPGRRLLDWPVDVIQLADSLGIQRFAAMGFSAGAPHVLACAKAIPGRLTAAILVGCPVPGAPTSGMPLMLRFMLLAPGLGARGFASSMSEMVRDPVSSARKSAGWLCEADRRLWADPDFARVFYEAIREGIRNGPGGVAADVALVFRRWGFNLREVRTRVHLWHGDEDRMAPVAFGHYAASLLPDCVANFCPGEGHPSTLVHRMNEILAVAARVEPSRTTFNANEVSMTPR